MKTKIIIKINPYDSEKIRDIIEGGKRARNIVKKFARSINIKIKRIDN